MRVIEARGSHFDIGQQLGEQCRDTAIRLMGQFRSTWDKRKVSREEAIRHSKYFLQYAKDFYSSYVDELAGYARATGLEFDEVFAWLCYDPPAPKGCTDLVLNHRVTANKHTYMVHNEDYDVAEEDYAVMVRVFPEGSPAFIAMTYGGVWFNGGVNQAGIGVAGNGLSHNDSRIGIPGDFSFRKILSARTIGDAMRFSTPEGRSFSYCNIICDDNGEMYSMEGSATDFAALHAREFLAHSNHYLSPRMEKYDEAFQEKTDRSPDFYSDSIVRYNRAINMIKDCSPGVTVQDMQNIMADHVNYPWSLCRHPDENQLKEERSKTVFSEIIDVTDRTIWVCSGNPCENGYEKHALEG